MILTPEHLARLDTTNRTVIRKDGFRRSAVLAAVARVEGEDHFLLTRRSESLPHHKGQIAFPGGAMDEGETPEQAAIREAFEEVHLPKDHVTVITELNDIWTPSAYIITPVLAFVTGIGALEPNPAEVDRVFTVPVAFFADETNATARPVTVRGYRRDVYFYHFDGETIWGATAFIIRDLLARAGALT